jgi:acyl-homoserine lactone acylase PvdQ
VTVDTVTVPFRTGGEMGRKEFVVFRTHHGPVVREVDGKWVSVRLMEEPVKALMQSYSRTKVRNLGDFRETMELHTNSSNNTVFADAEGNIAYFHANFVPRRDTRFDWSRPVDGSDPATEWQGIHAVDESPNSINPPNGWVQNTNNWPFSVAGANSPKPGGYPSYMERGGENARGVHAIRVLDGRRGFTLDSLIAAAYDSYLTAFEDLIPVLLAGYDQLPGGALKTKVAEPIALLRAWDLRWGVSSVPTAVAVFWAEELAQRVSAGARGAAVSIERYIATRTSPLLRIEALAAAMDRLEADFGSWRTPWGEVNRFQRLTGDIVQPFDDAGPSIPVGFTSARYGSLASFGAARFNGSRKLYGTSGNSFVAVVEFGDSVRARAVTAGGLSSNVSSPHFNDQAARYAAGDLRPVYFYRNQLEGHIEREYHPGG